ncbi:sigma-70 family RNA polymerase sigma factor [Myceligenerans crystallogenes]|uniref:RNA polymerase sigma-70 factor, ECF subfamily n=1 Tax=Myceligenerans crystallogenes TaxID=316335 RepID=A0ABP4ZT26_9MICO
MTRWDAELTQMVRQRGPALVGYAYMLTSDRSLAEDLVQDALVKVYSRFSRPRGQASGAATVDLTNPITHPEAYLRQTILTLYLDGYRRRRRWTGVRHLLAGDESTRSAEHAASARTDVGAALRALTPKQRACVVLRYYEDRTVPQIAEALGVSQGTVKRHLFDAMPTLRGLLGGDHDQTAAHGQGEAGKRHQGDRRSLSGTKATGATAAGTAEERGEAR